VLYLRLFVGINEIRAGSVIGLVTDFASRGWLLVTIGGEVGVEGSL
jgi:hypothetical protein